MKEKKAKKGKKAKVTVKDLEVKTLKAGADSEDPKGGFNPQPEPPALMNKVQTPAVKPGFDPQPEPPGRGVLGGRIR